MSQGTGGGVDALVANALHKTVSSMHLLICWLLVLASAVCECISSIHACVWCRARVPLCTRPFPHKVCGSRGFSRPINNRCVLCSLWFVGNAIGGEGAAAIAEALRTNSTLTELGLSRAYSVDGFGL